MDTREELVKLDAEYERGQAGTPDTHGAICGDLDRRECELEGS